MYADESRFRAQKAMEYKDLGWQTIQCPVKIAGDLCEARGNAAASSDSASLLRCAKCKKVLYCGKECQAADWKAHKPFCVRG